MAQTPNLSLYYSFPGSLPHKSFVEQLSENMSKIDSAYSRISSALSSMSTQLASISSVVSEKATEDTFTTTVSTQDWGSAVSYSEFVSNQILSNGDKIHFDTTKGAELESAIRNMSGTAVFWINAVGTVHSSSANFLLYAILNDTHTYLFAVANNGEGGIIPIYSDHTGSSVEDIQVVQGFQNLDVNGDYTITGLTEDCRVFQLQFPDDINGVIISSPSGEAGPPYTKTVALTGILETDNPVCDIVVSDTYATAEQELIDWSNIYKITTDNGSITLYAKEPPVGAMTIQLKVVR